MPVNRSLAAGEIIPHEPIVVLLQMCCDIIDGSAWVKVVMIFAFMVTSTIYGLEDE